MSSPKQAKAKAGQKHLKRWQINLIFVLIVLAAAAVLYAVVRSQSRQPETKLVAEVEFGSGVVETLPLDKDYDYIYDVGNYVVHLQVKDGAVSFQDSQCPDHTCEQFGWLDQENAWAACIPAGVFVTVTSQTDSAS